jgi:hypothetical protein
MPNWTAALQRVVNYAEISVAIFLICLCKMLYKTIGILLSVTARRALIAFCILTQGHAVAHLVEALVSLDFFH